MTGRSGRKKEEEAPKRASPFEAPTTAATSTPGNREPHRLWRHEVIRFSVVRWLLHIFFRFASGREWAYRMRGHYTMMIPRRQRRAKPEGLSHRDILRRAHQIVLERDPQWSRLAPTPQQIGMEIESISRRYLFAQVAAAAGLVLDFLYGPIFAQEAFRRLSANEFRRHASILHIFGLSLYSLPDRRQYNQLPRMAGVRADPFLDHQGGETPAAGTSPTTLPSSLPDAGRWGFPPGTTVRHRASVVGSLRQPSASWENQFRSGGPTDIGACMKTWALFEWRVLLWAKGHLQEAEDEERRGRTSRRSIPGSLTRGQALPHGFSYRFSCMRPLCPERHSAWTSFFCVGCLGWYCERRARGKDHNCAPLRSPWE